MTTRILAFLVAISVTPLIADDIQINPRNQSDEIELGDMTIDVVRALGQPKGQLDKEAEKRKLLYYPRGLVDLKDDRVFEFKLLTEEQLIAREKRRQAEREAKEREIAELHAAMLEEAAAERQRIQEDENFETLPAAKRVAYWRQFQSKYPGAPIDSESYQNALVEYNDTKERATMEAELARLKAEADPGPRPRLSSKKVKRMKRAGTWKWDDEEADDRK